MLSTLILCLSLSFLTQAQYILPVTEKMRCPYGMQHYRNHTHHVCADFGPEGLHFEHTIYVCHGPFSVTPSHHHVVDSDGYFKRQKWKLTCDDANATCPMGMKRGVKSYQGCIPCKPCEVCPTCLANQTVIEKGNCTYCPNLTYLNTTTLKCNACPVGMAAADDETQRVGLESCHNCTEAQIIIDGVCSYCAPGEYLNGTQCATCPEGSISATPAGAGVETCTPCDEGLTALDNRCQNCTNAYIANNTCYTCCEGFVPNTDKSGCVIAPQP